MTQKETWNGNANHPVFRFDSLSALVDYAGQKSPNGGRGRTLASRDRSDHRVRFTGSRSWEDAVSLAFGGWVDGARRINRRRAAISALTEGEGNTVLYKRRGPGALSSTRYIQGHPRPYLCVEKTPAPKRAVRILVNVCQSGGVSPESIERRGAAVCSLVDALEANGRTVEVVTVAPHGYATYFCTVKRSGQRLNLPSLAFALAHPSMLRRIIFGAIEQSDEKVWRLMAGTYGRVENVEPEPGTIYLGSTILREFATDIEAAEWVKATAATQGVNLT